MSKKIPPDENGGHPPRGDGIPDGVEKPSKPAGATGPKARPRGKDGHAPEDGRERLTRDDN